LSATLKLRVNGGNDNGTRSKLPRSVSEKKRGQDRLSG
jgi:hypothetical protein